MACSNYLNKHDQVKSATGTWYWNKDWKRF